MTEVWHRVAAVVAEWLLSHRAPRDLLAEMAALRREPVAVRAAVAREVQAVVGARRRLEWGLWGAAPPAGTSPRLLGAALALAHAVERHELSPAAAGRSFTTLASSELDFAPVLSAASRAAGMADPVQRFAVLHSQPDWLAEAFLRQFGDGASGLAAALAGPAPRTLRANTLRVASRADLAAQLAAEGVSTRATAHAPHGLVVVGNADLFATACYRSGCFEQQDESSQLAALVVAPPPGGRVLDLCAGSGGKTLALAASMQNRGEILGTDVHRGRLHSLRERARRAGVDTVRAIVVDEGKLDPRVAEFAGRADRILVDAPCSGTGSWRRRPEARWSVTAGDLVALRATQHRLLATAAALLRPGARLVYATCSLLVEENEEPVRHLLAHDPGLELVRVSEVLGAAVARPITDATGTFLSLRPDHHDADGFFAAVLRRRRGR